MNDSQAQPNNLPKAGSILPADECVYPIYKVAVLAEVLADLGIEPSRLLVDTDINSDALYSAETRISRRQLLTAYRNAVALSPVPHIGLLVGRKLRVSEYGMYGYALMSSRTLGDALAFAIKYHQLATPTVRMSLFRDDDDSLAIFMMEDITFDDAILEFNLSLQFALVLSLFEDMVGEDFGFKQVRCSLPEPEHASEYSSILGCEVIFGAPHDELVFDEWWLSKTLRRANAITSDMLEKTCAELLQSMFAKDDIVSQVTAAVTASLEQGLDVDEVARQLNMSARTLRRRLSDNHSSYQQILQDVRCQIATAYLRDTQMTIDDIAMRVGFTESANFRHAFKRWTGHPPSYYRKQRRF